MSDTILPNQAIREISSPALSAICSTLTTIFFTPIFFNVSSATTWNDICLLRSEQKEWSPAEKLTRQIWGIWKLRPAYSPKTPNLGQNRWCFVPCDLEIWWKNNRAPLLFYFKLCAAFRTHWWNQTGVTVRKRPIWVKFDDF